MLILSLAALRDAGACILDDRIAAFRTHHGREPDDQTPLRDWLACTPAVGDWIWATRCLGGSGRVLALTVATRAARRALDTVGWDHAADPRPLHAVEAAEVVLAAWRSGAGPDEVRRANAARAAADAAAAAQAAARAAAYAADAAARAAAYAAAAAAAAQAADRAAAYAAYAAARAAAYAADAAAAAQAADRAAAYAAAAAAQRADYLAALDEIE